VGRTFKGIEGPTAGDSAEVQQQYLAVSAAQAGEDGGDTVLCAAFVDWLSMWVAVV
jgi:hypothetical protein